MNEGGCDRTGELLAKVEAIGVDHSPHCCRSRRCHDVCSNLCGTDLEATTGCVEHEYCRARHHLWLAAVDANRRLAEAAIPLPSDPAEAPGDVELYGQRVGDEA